MPIDYTGTRPTSAQATALMRRINVVEDFDISGAVTSSQIAYIHYDTSSGNIYLQMDNTNDSAHVIIIDQSLNYISTIPSPAGYDGQAKGIFMYNGDIYNRLIIGGVTKFMKYASGGWTDLPTANTEFYNDGGISPSHQMTSDDAGSFYTTIIETNPSTGISDGKLLTFNSSGVLIASAYLNISGEFSGTYPVQRCVIAIDDDGNLLTKVTTNRSGAVEGWFFRYTTAGVLVQNSFTDIIPVDMLKDTYTGNSGLYVDLTTGVFFRQQSGDTDRFNKNGTAKTSIGISRLSKDNDLDTIFYEPAGAQPSAYFTISKADFDGVFVDSADIYPIEYDRTPYVQSTFYRYPDRGLTTNEETLGTPDAGVSVPASGALLTLTNGDIHRPHYAELDDMRIALRAVAPFYINAVTGNDFVSSGVSADNIFTVAIDAGQSYWTTPTVGSRERMRVTDFSDIDLVLETLEASALA